MVNKILLMVFIFLFMLNGVYALDSMGVFEKNTTIRISQVCVDATYINISSISYPNSTIAISNIIMTSMGSGGYYYDFTKAQLNGRYDVRGISDGCEKTFASYFDITPNGQLSSEGSSTLYLGILAILVVFLILSIYCFVEFDNLLNRVGMLSLSYLFLIAISFISWQMASDFITSAPFLISMLRIIFFVLVVGAFPLLIGSFVWYFLMLFKIKEIERLMDKGFSMDEAERRVEN